MPCTPEQVSAVLVTYGDHDVSRILDSFRKASIDDVVVWNNSAPNRQDLKTYGRYAAIPEAQHQILLFQDDDIYLPPTTIRALLEEYEPGVIVANMSDAWAENRGLHDSCFVGAGAVLDRDIPAKAFARYDTLFPRDELFLYYPEAIVTIPSRFRRVDLPLEVLEWGYAPNRMNAKPWFVERMQESIVRGRRVRDSTSAT